MGAGDDDSWAPSAEQAEEVRRRLADADAETMTLEEFNEHCRQLLGQ
jgi:hypothetical protein